MKKIGLVVLSLLLASPLWAADNAVIVTPGVGLTMKSKDIGGFHSMQPSLVDSAGAEILGVVTASPAANTIGARLVTINTSLGTINTTLGTPLQAGGTVVLTAETTKVIGTVRIASGGVASGSYASGAFASGAFASGSIGSGAIASGAVASGAFASGALASGSIASGAMVDLLTIIGTKAAGTAAASSALIGCVYNTALPTLTNGQQAAVQCDTSARPYVNVANTNANGQATMANSSPVVIASNQTSVKTVNGGSTYETVAASQTGQVLGGSGAIGDYLSHCVIYPTSTTPGVVTVFDDATGAGANVIAFPGGASSVSNLAPIAIPVGAVSVTGEWRVTTGANLVVTCYGTFT